MLKFLKLFFEILFNFKYVSNIFTLPDSEKKKNGQFNRIEDLPQSEISAFFFNQVVKIGDKGFYRVPNYTDLNAG